MGGLESSSATNLPLNVPVPNQMNFGSGGTSSAPSALPSMNTGSTGISSASSIPGAPPPYETHSFSGAMAGSGRTSGTAAVAGVGGVNQPTTSMFGGGVAGSASMATGGDSMQSTQQNVPNTAAKSTPNLEAAR